MQLAEVDFRPPEDQVTGGIMGGRRMNRPTQLRTNAHPCVIMRYNANLALAHQRKEV